MAVVYRHRRDDTNEIFYVGIAKEEKGNKYRPYAKTNRNHWWYNIINKTTYQVEIIAKDLDWDSACELEQLLIKEYGRKDLDLGSLVNLTDGGEGIPGRICSEETKLKISNSHKGKIRSLESRENQSKSRQGLKPSTEVKLKMSLSHKLGYLNGRKSGMFGKEAYNKIHNKIIQYDLNENIIRIWNNITEISNFYNCQRSAITRVCNGERKTFKNTKLKYDESK